MFELKDVLTLLIALAGLLLGVVNYVRSVQADQVRLRVIPKLMWPRAGGILTLTTPERAEQLASEFGPPTLVIEVVNIGKVTAVVDQVGFCCSHPERGERAAILNPIRDQSVAWPTRLEARASATYILAPNGAAELGTKWSRAYACTACGKWVTGTSKAYRYWRKHLWRLMRQ